MGLPSLGDSKPDISSDSENDYPDESGLGKAVPSEMSETTKQIAKKWLQSVKGKPEQESFGAASGHSGHVLHLTTPK